jgi:hypothetical protein
MNESAKAQRIESDPLAKTIVSIMNAMAADYGRIFTKQFHDQEAITFFKRRLYQKLKGLEIEAIIEGYELCIGRNTKFCPTVPEIVGATLETVKDHKKRDQLLSEAARVSALPAPKITKCNPLEMLANAQLKKQGEKEETREEWVARKAGLLENHDAVLVLNSYKIYRKFAGTEHGCGYGGCNNAGALSSATKGNGNYYCATHYRMSA